MGLKANKAIYLLQIVKTLEPEKMKKLMLCHKVLTEKLPGACLRKTLGKLKNPYTTVVTTYGQLKS
jgi:hypothetical protein